ncbi:MAG: cell division/cell wall cluster transcriptional repressor MraZ, partial [Pseudomonadota bacterium]|nr:cell division/cell wall cluster transcriptional repressor MraZ [Pseudomonadota bacterium]
YSPFDEGCLYLYPHRLWERVRDQVNALPRIKQKSRLLQLKLVGAAAFAEPDGNARISIPASHRSAVGIEKKAVLLGMGDKFELWSEQAHHEQIRQTLGDADLGEDLLDLAL